MFQRLYDRTVSFLKPDVLKYYYEKPRCVSVQQIRQILKSNVSLLGDNDVVGWFEKDDIFYMRIHSAVFTRGVRFGCRLKGQLSESVKDGVSGTQISVSIPPSLVLYIIFFLGLVFGLISLYFFFAEGRGRHLIECFIYILGFPFFSVWFFDVSRTAVVDRFECNVDRKLRLT